MQLYPRPVRELSFCYNGYCTVQRRNLCGLYQFVDYQAGSTLETRLQCNAIRTDTAAKAISQKSLFSSYSTDYCEITTRPGRLNDGIDESNLRLRSANWLFLMLSITGAVPANCSPCPSGDSPAVQLYRHVHSKRESTVQFEKARSSLDSTGRRTMLKEPHRLFRERPKYVYRLRTMPQSDFIAHRACTLCLTNKVHVVD